MNNTHKSVYTVTLNKSLIECVMAYISEERETLFALSTAIASMVAAEDPKNLKASDNLCAFRLVELLKEKLGSTEFEQNIRKILGVEV